ncbi:hypothetical protein HRbin40_01879 [bacterium HR40]|nr:hypothetical protein HRbin40_01879 [bacterium HR40]
MPSLAFSFLVLASLFGASAEARSDPCAGMLVPAESGLRCEVATGDAAPGTIARIVPQAGQFADLSRMTVRELDRRRDELAWTRPGRWLESRMEVDLGAYVEALSRFARDPDSPLASDGVRRAIQALALGLGRLGRLALAACDRPTRNHAGHHLLRCRYGGEGFALHMQVRLVAAGDRRYAINIRTLSDRRLRHFEAIANSFRPTS